MKTFLSHLRDIAISGFFALLPVYAVFIVIAKAWKSLSSVGNGIAGMFGMKSMLGVGGGTVFSGLLVITLWIVTGLLVRFSFIGAFSRTAERTLSKYIPGYDTYKTIAEEKLQHKVRVLPYTTALVQWQEYWQPGTSSSRTKRGTAWYFFRIYRRPIRDMFAGQTGPDKNCVIHHSQSTRRIIEEDGNRIVQ